MGMLIVSIVMAILPLIMAAILLFGVEGVDLTPTMDGLFMSIILLTISGIFGLNALLELRQMGLLPGKLRGKKAEANPGKSAPRLETKRMASSDGVHTYRGEVKDVQYYEAGVGQHNKSLVTLKAKGSETGDQMVFAGDVRNALPKGKTLEITYRSSGDSNTLLTARDM
ncbi:MAG: hypothetical protein L0212_05160 [Acidobacteria bacterium]|nr:hypothetical protein [Acidobacteriota bacterium]